MKANCEELYELIEEVDEHITTIANVGAAQKIQTGDHTEQEHNWHT
jgi:hypothetical protein